MIRLRPATATVAAATLAAALVAACSGGPRSAPALPPVSSCHPGTSGAASWIIDGAELSAADSVGPSSVRHAFSPAHLLVLVHGAQTSSAGREVADFRSYAAFQRAIRQGTIRAGIHWVMYDNEKWSLTPANEQADPVRYEQLFAQLAHRNGYRVILAPAQDLVPGFSSGTFKSGKPAWQSYLSMGLATASARYGDIYEIQAQRYETGPYRSQHAYASFVAAAAARARAANPNIVIYAGLSTQRASSAAQLLQDYMATRHLVDGYWLNIPHYNQPGPVALAVQFFRSIPASASARATACGGT
jgi:hypothetical protein